MTNAATRPNRTRKKRAQGRPVVGKNDVGRERLVAAAEKLLRRLPTARVTMVRVAQEANVDPALVRYYFGDRTALLLAVVDRVTAHSGRVGERKDKPLVALAEHIGKTVQFVRSATFMHRLIVDELAQAGTEASRERVKAMNLDLVEFYRELLDEDGGAEFIPTDPLLLHLAVLGASDFFASAQVLIRELVPGNANMDELTNNFQTFLVNLVINGLRKR